MIIYRKIDLIQNKSWFMRTYIAVKIFWFCYILELKSVSIKITKILFILNKNINVKILKDGIYITKYF